jgi:hypothetical protein
MDDKVQSVLIPRDKFTVTQARRWVREHGYEIIKIDITTNYYRFRQRDPIACMKYRTLRLPNGVKLVREYH